jgi:hypothetical protein
MFHNRTLEDYGIPLASQKIVPGDTVTAVSSGGYTHTQRTLAFTAGGTTVPVVGDLIVGATSGASAVITAISALTGKTAWANSDAAGSFTVKNQIGKFTAAEKLKIGADADIAEVTANSVAVATDYRFKNALAKVAVIQVLAQTALVCVDGSNPDQTALKGWSIPAGGTLVVLEEAIPKIKVVDRVSGSASTVFIQFYF